MSEAGPLAAKPGHQWRPTRSAFGCELGRRRWDLLVEGASGLQRRILWLGCEEAGPGSRGLARDAGHRLWVATWGVCEPDHRARAGPRTPARAAARDTADPFGGDGSVAAGRRSTNCVADPGLETPAMAIQRRRGWPRAEGWAPTQTEARGSSRRAEGESRKPGNGVAPGVLVTTRSVAEIGSRHLSRGTGCTPVRLRFGGIAGSGGPSP
jgi:hypothetical protein